MDTPAPMGNSSVGLVDATISQDGTDESTSVWVVISIVLGFVVAALPCGARLLVLRQRRDFHVYKKRPERPHEQCRLRVDGDVERGTQESATLTGAVRLPPNMGPKVGRNTASASTENIHLRPGFISPAASSRAVENERNEAKLEEEIDVEAGTFSLPPTQFHPTWLRSCGEVESRARLPPADGAPLSIHSVGRMGLCVGPGRGTRPLHLPPDEAQVATCHRWRDKHGQVEVMFASKDRSHAEHVRLLAKAYVEEVLFRGEVGPCVIKPVIQGPSGVAFQPGTASISYFLGRYGTLVRNKGDKGGVGGMEGYVRDNYFPVVQRLQRGSWRWVADYDYQVVWKGDEAWLVTELQGFSRKGLAEKWGRFKARVVDCRGSSVDDVARGPGDVTTPRTLSPSSTPPQPSSRLSLQPLASSEKLPDGSIEVHNATEESLQVMLIPETFLTAEVHGKYRETNAALTVAGQGASAAHTGSTNGSMSQQCRIMWCSVSAAFHPEDLPIPSVDKDDESIENRLKAGVIKSHECKNRLTAEVIKSHEYDIVVPGWFNKTMHFKEKASGRLHRSLLFVRLWSQTSIKPANKSTMHPELLKEHALWGAPVPNTEHVTSKVIDGLSMKFPVAGGPPTW